MKTRRLPQQTQQESHGASTQLFNLAPGHAGREGGSCQGAVKAGLRIRLNTAFTRLAWSPARRGLWKLNVVEAAQSRRDPPSPGCRGDAAQGIVRRRTE